MPTRVRDARWSTAPTNESSKCSRLLHSMPCRSRSPPPALAATHRRDEPLRVRRQVPRQSRRPTWSARRSPAELLRWPRPGCCCSVCDEWLAPRHPTTRTRPHLPDPVPTQPRSTLPPKRVAPRPATRGPSIGPRDRCHRSATMTLQQHHRRRRSDRSLRSSTERVHRVAQPHHSPDAPAWWPQRRC